MRLLIRVAFWVVVLDQASKWIVVQVLDLRSKGVIEVLPPWLTFRMAWNEGINFGLFAQRSDLARWGLVAVALVISAWVVWWVRRHRREARVQVAAGLLVGGALGNVIDRIVWGAVADFLNMTCCGLANPYAFNLADIGIFLGALGLILWADRAKTP
jgi:signal peptidase II